MGGLKRLSLLFYLNGWSQTPSSTSDIAPVTALCPVLVAWDILRLVLNSWRSPASGGLTVR